MTSSKVLVTVMIAASAAWAACGAAAPPPAPPAKPAPSLADLTDAMCACKDAACATKVRADFADVERAAKADVSPHAAAQRAYAATCEDTAREGDDQATLDRMKDAMCACKDSACIQKVEHDFEKAMNKLDEKYGHGTKPDAKLLHTAEEMSSCIEATMGGGHDADADADADKAPKPWVSGAPYDTGVPECDGYMRAIDVYMACDKIPQQAKDAVAQGAAQMQEAFPMLKDPSVPAEAKKAADDACVQAHDALDQSAAAMSCTMPARKPPPPPAKAPKGKHPKRK